MRVVTKVVKIEDQEFVLIFDNKDNRDFYATIPYSELNDDGSMKRELNGFEMCISDTIDGAIKRRTNKIAIDKFKKEGHSEEELITFIMNLK